MILEAALIGLGTAAVRSALKLWLADRQIAADVAVDAVDRISAGLTRAIDRRKLGRLSDQLAETVFERLEPLVEQEFRNVPEYERAAAVEAVRSTLEQAALTDDDLFAADLDAGYLDRHVRTHDPHGTDDLSEGAARLYDLVLRECCGYIIEIARVLPSFSPGAMTEILRRQTEILTEIRQGMARLPYRREAGDFEYDYRQVVARTLDQMEMFGATLSGVSRRYPLSVAYLSLTATSQVLTPGRRLEELLGIHRRLFVRGDAGIGKTTMLQWIAVRSALGDFPASLGDWNDTVPFFVPLRRYAHGELPPPESFVSGIARHIAAEMPEGWAHRQLREGRAVLLVDGMDEVESGRRERVRHWLSDLVLAFPNARYVVTTRPGGAPRGWLEGQGFVFIPPPGSSTEKMDLSFTDAGLNPMTPPDVHAFVRRWHDAMRSQSTEDDERRELTAYQERLLRALGERLHLRRLAGYPLLCALLCALHRDRRGDLPANRMELYEVALHMLLERRDKERGLQAPDGLNRTEKTLILADLAYWLVRNSRTEAETAWVVERIGRKLTSMPQVKADAVTVVEHLLERSGVIREPIVGRVDFVHRTLQEYLAAKAAVDEDDFDVLIDHADLDQWHEVLVMACGHARQARREQLLEGLLNRKDASPAVRLLAVACLETAAEIPPPLRTKIREQAAQLLPPRSVDQARSLAAGEFVLDLLAKSKPETARATAATVRTAAEIGTDSALDVLARFGTDKRGEVLQELVSAWLYFDAESYAQVVLADAPIDRLVLTEPASVAASRHLRHLKALTWNASSAAGVKLNGEVDLALVPLQIDHLVVATDRPVDLTRLHAKALSRLELVGPILVGTGPPSLPPTIQVDVLEVERADLVDLSPLRCVAGLQILTLDLLPSLHRLDPIEQWSDSLYGLMIRDCPNLSSITPIRKLTRLRKLFIDNPSVFASIPVMPDVEVMTGYASSSWLS